MQKNIQKAILSLTFYEFFTFFLLQHKKIHIFAVMHNHYLSYLPITNKNLYEFFTFFLLQHKQIHIFAVMHNHYLSQLLWTKISMNFLRFFYCNKKKFIYLQSCITIISLSYYEQKSLWISYVFSTATQTNSYICSHA